MNYLVKLHETNGEYEYTHTFMVEADSFEEADVLAIFHASEWYGEADTDTEYAGYSFHGGEVIVYVHSVRPLTQVEYEVLSQHFVTL